MRAPPLARCAGCGAVRGAVRRCRLREDPSGGPLDALRRRGTRLRLAAARHGTGLVTADGDIAARSEPERDPNHVADVPNAVRDGHTDQLLLSILRVVTWIGAQRMLIDFGM